MKVDPIDDDSAWQSMSKSLETATSDDWNSVADSTRMTANESWEENQMEEKSNMEEELRVSCLKKFNSSFIFIICLKRARNNIVVSIEFSPLSTVELTTNWYQLHNGDYFYQMNRTEHTVYGTVTF